MISQCPIAVSCLAFLTLAPVGGASDWPQWRGPNRDGHLPAGVAAPASIPAELKTLWRIKAGDGLASPVISQGRLLHLDNQAGQETVHCLDPKNGAILWSHRLDEAFKDSQSTPGPRCTPLIDGNRVYAQSCRGELHCLNLNDGTLLWRVNYVTNFQAVFIGEKGQAAGAARHGYNAQPLIDGNHLMTVAGGTNGASVVCLDKLTGQVVWQSQNDGASYAPPILAQVAGRKQFIAFTVESLLGLDPVTGGLLWRVPLKTTFGRHVTTPVVVDDIVTVSSHEFGLIGVRVQSSGSSLAATVAWTNKAAAINFSSPVAIGRHLYGVGPNKNLICVDTKTGALSWSKDDYFTSPAGKAHAGLIVAGGNLLVLSDSGTLSLVAGEAGAFRELGRTQVGGNNWCNPAFADGTLYLRDSRQLIAVRLLP